MSKLRRRSARIAEDLRLDDHVERGRRLVGDEDLRVQHQRQRDHDPLPHPARELVRVLLEAGRRDAHRRRAPRASARRISSSFELRLVRLAASRRSGLSIVISGSSRVIGSWKISPSSGPRSARTLLGRCGRRGSRPSIADLAGGGGAVGQQPEDRPAERRLAAARLADQPERLAGSAISNETPSTARTGSPPVPYQTRRSRTSRTDVTAHRSLRRLRRGAGDLGLAHAAGRGSAG